MKLGSYIKYSVRFVFLQTVLTLLTINCTPLHLKYASTAFYKRELYAQNNSYLN